MGQKTRSVAETRFASPGRRAQEFVMAHPVRSERWPLVLLGVGLLLSPALVAAQPAKPDEPKKELQRKVTFQTRDQPWDKVLEWLTDQTGLPFTGGTEKPQ